MKLPPKQKIYNLLKRENFKVFMGILTSYLFLIFLLLIVNAGYTKLVVDIFSGYNILIFIIPFYAWFLIYQFLDEKHIEKLFHKNTSIIFTAFIAMLGLIMNAIQGETFLNENVIFIGVIFYALICIIFTFLSLNKKTKSIFGISSILLIVILVLLFFNLKSSVAIYADEFLGSIFYQIGWMNQLPLNIILKIITAILLVIFSIYWSWIKDSR